MQNCFSPLLAVLFAPRHRQKANTPHKHTLRAMCLPFPLKSCRAQTGVQKLTLPHTRTLTTHTFYYFQCTLRKKNNKKCVTLKRNNNRKRGIKWIKLFWLVFERPEQMLASVNLLSVDLLVQGRHR